MVTGLLGRIDTFRSDGGKVVWTVHNVYPHDARFVDEELRLQQGLADRADVVHVMARSTTDHMDGILTLDPDRTVLAPAPQLCRRVREPRVARPRRGPPSASTPTRRCSSCSVR